MPGFCTPSPPGLRHNFLMKAHPFNLKEQSKKRPKPAQNGVAQTSFRNLPKVGGNDPLTPPPTKGRESRPHPTVQRRGGGQTASSSGRPAYLGPADLGRPPGPTWAGRPSQSGGFHRPLEGIFPKIPRPISNYKYPPLASGLDMVIHNPSLTHSLIL